MRKEEKPARPDIEPGRVPPPTPGPPKSPEVPQPIKEPKLPIPADPKAGVSQRTSEQAS